MKKLLTFALTLSLVCCLASCNTSDNSSKTAELEKRVAELESQISEQPTTTTTTTAAATTTASSQTTTTTTTTTAATTTTKATTTTPETTTTEFPYQVYEVPQTVMVNGRVLLFDSPTDTANLICEVIPGGTFEIIGEINSEWKVALIENRMLYVKNSELEADMLLD